MVEVRVCEICGDTFIPTNGRQKKCNKKHYQPCPICGKDVLINVPSEIGKCCSRKCGQAKQKVTIKNTLLERYGTTDPKAIVNFKERECAYCGKLFKPTSSNQKYCGEDYYDCPICRKPVRIKDMSAVGSACSEECRQEKIRRTNLERYGVECVFENSEIIEKIKETNLKRYGSTTYIHSAQGQEQYVQTSLERFGTTHPLKNDKVKQKLLDTNNRKYGGNSPMCDEGVKSKAKETVIDRYGGFTFSSDELSDKAKRTLQARYGVDHPMRNGTLKAKQQESLMQSYGVSNPLQSQEIRDKVKQTNLRKYGYDHYSKTEAFKRKIKITCLDRYGQDNPSKVSEFKQKMRDRWIEEYGCDNPMKSNEVKKKSEATCLKRYGAKTFGSSKRRIADTVLDTTKVDEFLSFKNDPKSYIENKYVIIPSEMQLANDLGVTITTVSKILIETGNRHLASFKVSTMENEVCQFILSACPNIKILRNNKTVIAPYELDIYIPEFNFAIECNPTYTHNSSLGDCWGGDPKNRNYHKMKTDLCEESGITLFHVFGYEWTHRQDVIKSMILNDLNQTVRTIYARKTYVVVLDSEECAEFLDRNHLQRGTYASIRLGLRDKDTDDLVSCMTFNKTRSTIGYSSNSCEGEYELSRFCSEQNTNVVGGASKLFKYFLENYDYKKIVSFSDRAHASGDLYKVLGFKKVSLSDPSYMWVNYANDSYLNRVSCQKKNLRKLFKDDTINIENQTEREIMESHGFVQVFDSGKIRWEYVLPSTVSLDQFRS